MRLLSRRDDRAKDRDGARLRRWRRQQAEVEPPLPLRDVEHAPELEGAQPELVRAQRRQLQRAFLRRGIRQDPKVSSMRSAFRGIVPRREAIRLHEAAERAIRRAAREAGRTDA